MIKIERKGFGYTVKASEPGTGLRGWSVFARDIDEVKLATEHYFAGHQGIPGGSLESCPLCREVAKRS